MLTLEFCVLVFSGSVKARILKLGIHMNNEMLYCGTEKIRLIALILPFIYPFFCLLRLNLCQFSQELYKLVSSIMVYICRMSDCIVGLRLRVMAFILVFLLIFLSFPILHVNIKKLGNGFLRKS